MLGLQRGEESDSAGTVPNRLYELELERWVDLGGWALPAWGEMAQQTGGWKDGEERTFQVALGTF